MPPPSKRNTFATKERADEYVDTAIARNIQHSLRCYQNEGHFRHLRDLYEAGELTSAINRVVEDINHRFTLEVLTRDFRSSDLSISAGNLRRDRANPTDILDRVDVSAVTENLRTLLEIRSEPPRGQGHGASGSLPGGRPAEKPLAKIHLCQFAQR